MNFGAGDDAERVAENVRRLADAAGFQPQGLRQVTQVHGAVVVDAEATLNDARARVEADGLFLSRVGTGPAAASAVGIRVADCVPVLVATRDRGEVSALHAGWRGVVGGVIAAGVGALQGKDVLAAVGPCIGPCCFEVGAEVAERIAQASGEGAVIVRRMAARAEAKTFVDLRRAVEAQLRRLGVRDVEQVPGCTKCDASRFFSYRRDGAESGRHLAVIALRPFYRS